MPLALKVDLDQDSLSDVKSALVDAFDGIGGQAGHVFAEGMANTLSGALHGVTSEFGAFGKAAESVLSNIPVRAAAAAAGIGGIVVAAAAAGKALYDLGARWDDIADSITQATGKTGAELEALQKVVGDVGSMTAASLADIGKVVEQLSQQFPNLDTAGESIRLMASDLAYLSQSGQSVNIHELGLAMRVFGVSAESGTKALDDFAAVSRATGVPINTLITEVRSGAPIFKQFGLDMGEASAYLAAFDSAGIDAGSTMTGLRAALVSLSGDSRGAREALQATIIEIKRLSDAGDEAAARQLAIETFGKRAFAPMLEAIESGALDLDKLNKALDGTQMSLQEMQAATDDAKESWQELTNTMQTRFKPLGDIVFNAVNDGAMLLTGNLNRVQNGFEVTTDRAEDLRSKLDQIVELTRQFQPDSPLGRMLAPAGIPGAPTQGGLGPSGGIGGVGGLGRDSGLGVNQGEGGFYPTPKPGGGAGGGELVPYGPGYGVQEPGESPEHYRARMNMLEQQHNVDEKQAQLDKLQREGASQDQLTKANNDLAEARVRATEAEQAMNKPSGAASQVEVPYGPGYGAPIRAGESLQQYRAEQNLIEAQHNSAQARAQLQQIEQSGVATANELTKARNDLAKAEAAEYEAQLRLNEAANGTTKSLDNIGVSLDKDFGLSQGLPGLAENLVRFVGSLAAAPLLGPLAAISQAQGGIEKTGSGLIGMAMAMSTPTDTSLLSAPGLSTVPVGAPTMLQDTGRTPSGPQSRNAAALIEQQWGAQLRGKIGGSRDTGTAPGTHDAGLAIDIPIGPDQKGLGDQINAWLQSNAGQLGLKYSIWRDRGQYPGGGGFNQPGHQDHIDAQFDPNFTPTGAAAMGPARNFAGGSIPIPLPVTIVGGSPGGTDAILASATRPTGGGTKDANASAIIEEGLRRGLGPEQIQAALAVAMQETDLGTNPRTNAIQTQNGTPGIQGMFQQDNSYNRYGDKTDPRVAARGFFDQFIARGGMNAADPYGFAVHNVQKPAPLGAGGYDDGTGNYLRNRWGGEAANYYNSLAPRLYDAGGVLPPGPTLAINNTGGPEQVVAPNAPPPEIMNPNIIGGPGGGGPAPGPEIGKSATAIGGGEQRVPKGGSAAAGGGLTGAATSAAAMAADMFAPGSGAAVQIASQEIQRAIKFGAQAAGIGVAGLMETFLPAGASQLANNNWLTRIGGAVSGAGAQLPNMAGKAPNPSQATQPPPPPTTPATGPGGPGGGGGSQTGVHIENYNVVGSEDRAGQDLARHQMAAATPPGQW